MTPEKAPPETAVIGPNAVVQLADAMREALGADRAEYIFRQSGSSRMFFEPPTEMVDERVAAVLYQTLFAALPDEVASGIAAHAGARTADYVLKNRIPFVARTILRLLPATLAAPALSRAIEKHAWTFAGSGAFRYIPGAPLLFRIADNPLAMPGCVWHRAVFERLFRRLVSRRTHVRQTRCCYHGAPFCEFEISIGATSDVDRYTR